MGADNNYKLECLQLVFSACLPRFISEKINKCPKTLIFRVFVNKNKVRNIDQAQTGPTQPFVMAQPPSLKLHSYQPNWKWWSLEVSVAIVWVCGKGCFQKWMWQITNFSLRKLHILEIMNAHTMQTCMATAMHTESKDRAYSEHSSKHGNRMASEHGRIRRGMLCWK